MYIHVEYGFGDILKHLKRCFNQRNSKSVQTIGLDHAS